MRLRNLYLSALCAAATMGLAQSSSAQTISVVYTTDVHGAIFNYDFVRDTIAPYSLSNVYSYVTAVRDTSKNVILLDNGDFLQGTPVVYYYNNVDTAGVNVMSRVFNFMGYDAVGVGNHDIEARHRVYDKIVHEIKAPMLSANIKHVEDNTPYFTPYTIIERAGKRIAVIGLTTPYIPHWLDESYWKGMYFEDMVEAARHWVKVVRETEKPDVVIGLFHAGYNYEYGNQNADTYKNENASVLVAERVDGFDAILIGHDHNLFNKEVTSPSGKKVPVLDAGVAARNAGLVSITFDKDGKPTCKASLVAMKNIKPSDEFDKNFLPQQLAVKAYTRKVIANLDEPVDAYKCLAGSSAFVDIVHRCMLKHTGAEISMTAPLLINARLPQGDITVGRMFSLYRYENTLCLVKMTGKEIKDYLEYSYDLWITNPAEGGHLLKMSRPGRLANNYYNLDSAAGIIYTVDVTAEKGKRVKIVSMADGSKFDKRKVYKVALNSYRANGGGGHLEFGAGIPYTELKDRIISSFETDLRGQLINDFEEMTQKDGKLNVEPLNQWRFVPEDVAGKALEGDIKLFM